MHSLWNTGRIVNFTTFRKHLLVSIGAECYVTLPKGQIIPTGDEGSRHQEISRIPGGGHVLIVPIEHYPTLGSMAPEVSLPIIDELERCATIVHSNVLTNAEMQIQIVPSLSLCRSLVLTHIFRGRDSQR